MNYDECPYCRRFSIVDSYCFECEDEIIGTGTSLKIINFDFPSKNNTKYVEEAKKLFNEENIRFFGDLLAVALINDLFIGGITINFNGAEINENGEIINPHDVSIGVDVVVIEKYRKKGIGSALMSEFLKVFNKKYKELGVEIYLEANSWAGYKLAEKFGFDAEL